MKTLSNSLVNTFILIVASALLIVSCSKESVIPEPQTPSYNKSTANSLISFSFERVNNADYLIYSYTAKIGNDKVLYLTLPNNVPLTALAPTIKASDKTTLSINGKNVESGVTKCDFSKTATLAITAENGNTNSYSVCIKNGDEKADNLIYDFMIKYSIPGVSLAISKNEEIIYATGFGFANKETKERVNSKHLFRLASVSKQQTALCIMTLYERGLIKLSDRVFGAGGILEKEFGTDIPAGAKEITVQHLLQHTSGYISSPDPMFTDNSAYAGKSLEERIEYVLKNVEQKYKAGSTYSYYNLGYGILGKIIEKLSGLSYETFLKQEVHAKAGVTDIHVGGDRAGKRANEVVYYSQDGTNGYGNDMEMIKAAGGIIASTEELMKLMHHIDYGTKVGDILKKETLDLMYTPSPVYARYGLGWRLNHSIFTNWASYHSGNLAGTAAIWARGVNMVHAVILCNSRSYISGFDDALHVLLEQIQSKY